MCFSPQPDRGHELAVDGRRVVADECVRAPEDAHGGAVRVSAKDRRGDEAHAWVRAPAGRMTIVDVDAKGRIRVVDRPTCDATPVL